MGRIGKGGVPPRGFYVFLGGLQISFWVTATILNASLEPSAQAQSITTLLKQTG
jgi:hypothetical protein